MAKERVIGLNPNQVPRNRDLGTAAYMPAGKIIRDGSSPEAAAFDATELWKNGVTASGWYWLKGWGSRPYRYYVNNNYRSGRWIMVAQIPNGTATNGWNLWDSTIVNESSTRVNEGQARIANIFSLTESGHDLELMCTVTYSDVEYKLGAIWRNIDVKNHLNQQVNTGITGGYGDEDRTESSNTGYTWTYQGVPDAGFHQSGAWEWAVAGSGGGNVGDYDRNDSRDGGWILHGSGGSGGPITRAYGHTDHGFKQNDTGWEIARIYVRTRIN